MRSLIWPLLWACNKMKLARIVFKWQNQRSKVMKKCNSSKNVLIGDCFCLIITDWNLCILGNGTSFFVVWWFFFQNQRFRKFLSEILAECQTVGTHVSPDILSGQNWFQTRYGPGYDKRYPMASFVKIKFMMHLQSTTTKEHFLKIWSNYLQNWLRYGGLNKRL